MDISQINLEELMETKYISDGIPNPFQLENVRLMCRGFIGETYSDFMHHACSCLGINTGPLEIAIVREIFTRRKELADGQAGCQS